MYESVTKFIDDNLDNSINALKALCKIPSVVAKNEGIEEAAELVQKMLNDVGLETEIHPTSGAPVVTGWLDVGAKRTLLFYNHYDVQPAEPLDLWDSPPFDPEIRNGRLYGRGVADNKGDTISRIWTLKAFKETNTDLPVNVRFVVEGEEEIGSINLPEYTEKNTDFITADGGIWEFGGEGIHGKQEAWLGLKGIFYVELEAERLSRDMHSASACILPSAASRLVWAINSLKDESSNILIEGFHDGIKPLSKAELEAIKKIDLHEEQLKKIYGIEEYLNGLTGDELKRAYYGDPTCNICGLTSGYQGKGSMTVLPAKASCKIDFRLVEGMLPDDIHKKLRKHLDEKGFTDIKIPYLEGYPAAKTPVDHPFVKIVDKANQRVFGEMVIHPTSGGSGPLYLFNKYVPMVSIGCGDYESKAHAPNESLIVENYRKSIHRIVAVMDEMSKW
ncbi:MAG: M20/M25/M40 family metallo-hydrolase [Candidatus Thorarchaeota archaeon]|jgi:acetylornithine deacetylase/succinyl-diaminopimelate desuccinylase-like protein